MHISPKKGILLGIVGLFGLGILFFFMLTGYYAWTLRFGDEEQIAALNDTLGGRRFSARPGAGAQTSKIDVPIDTIVRAQNPTYGNTDAKVTLVAFIDFECPFCRQAFPSFEQIREEFGPAVRIVFKHFPIDAVHPHANQASLAAQCAHAQGDFWNYYRILFLQQRLATVQLHQYANDIGLNTSAFETCLNSGAHQKVIQQDIQDGIAVGVRGTPTYALNQQLVEGVTDTEAWRQLIIEELQ